ncbi:alpha-L-rhamnosidase A [Phlyctochytrium arcticum]|nr:alpha-L-rhamnosidase A [Phlyctochytrium arcticum]
MKASCLALSVALAVHSSLAAPTVQPPNLQTLQPHTVSHDVNQVNVLPSLSAEKPWEKYMLSPSSRSIHPTEITSVTGNVQSPRNLIENRPTRFEEAKSTVILDFGKEVGGLVSLGFGKVKDAKQKFGVAFSESILSAGHTSDPSASTGRPESAIEMSATENSTWEMPKHLLRGGFRYMTIFLKSDGWADITNVTLHFTADPERENLADYSGNYFYSNDEQLNRIWYAGAYTAQLNIIASNEGRVWPPPKTEPWNNTGIVGVGKTVMVDGAKRDRTVWPADLGIATPAAFAAMNEIDSSQNALTTMYDAQSKEGEIPWSGPEFNLKGSDTYHLWTLLMTHTLWTYTNDMAWVELIWSRYVQGVEFSLGKVGNNNLMNVTALEDWARVGQGGENIAANSLLYGTLIGGSIIAEARGEKERARSWIETAAKIKKAINNVLWAEKQGAYKDNPASTLYPQDGNTLAVLLNVTDTKEQKTSIALKLATRWGYLGATTPEWSMSHGFHPLVSALEVETHFTTNQDHTALSEIRRLWPFMLDSPIGTASTFWEGVGPDGGFPYGGRSTFTSLAHGWSAGPTASLTYYVLGVSPESVPGQYRFVPHPGDLTEVSGSLKVLGGSLVASWRRDPMAGSFTMSLSAPQGQIGKIGIPKLGGGRQVQITINGKPVWDRDTYVPNASIGSGASVDDHYIYLEGVGAGEYIIVATHIGQSAPPAALERGLPAGWTLCATEGQECKFNGTRVVAYGAGTYTYLLKTSGVKCATADFGNTDPASKLPKNCFLAPEGGPGKGWTRCAEEGGSCKSLPAKGGLVAYGINGAFATAVAYPNTPCNSFVFGSPLATSAEALTAACWASPSGPPSADDIPWEKCADEGKTCTVNPGQQVAYGAHGSFMYITADNSTVGCNQNTFGGEPLLGVFKACYIAPEQGGPNGYHKICKHGERCTLSADVAETIAYGASGKYHSGTSTRSLCYTITVANGCTGSCLDSLRHSYSPPLPGTPP